MTSPLQELGLPSDALLWHAVLLTLLSFGVGVLGGFVGLALGSMRLPALLLLGVPPTVAAGTNIVVSSASAFVGALRHLREGRVEMTIALAMGAPSVAGAFLGGFYSRHAPEGLLILAVGLLVMWQGLEMARHAWASRALPTAGGGGPRGMDERYKAVTGRSGVLAQAAIGSSIGVLGGAVGLILGSLRLPALIRVLRLDPHVAAGTNLFIGFILGASGWLGHAARGQVDYPLAALMAASAMGGSYIGARLTGRVDARRLLASMGVVLVAVGALLVWRGAAI